MRYIVESRLQDSNWELEGGSDCLDEAIHQLRTYMRNPLSGMGRIIETRSYEATILIELPGNGWTKEAKKRVKALLANSGKEVETNVRVESKRVKQQRKIQELEKWLANIGFVLCSDGWWKLEYYIEIKCWWMTRHIYSLVWHKDLAQCGIEHASITAKGSPCCSDRVFSPFFCFPQSVKQFKKLSKVLDLVDFKE